MKQSVLSVGTVADLELRQRVRSTAWYVLLGISGVVLAAVTLLLLVTAGAFGGEGGDQIVSTVVFMVLLLGTLVTPALSGAAVNGDREAGTLATTQVTLISTWQLLLGKFLAAWAAALAFLVVASPFLVIALIAGGVEAGVVLTALGVTVLELGVVAAVGVGLSAVIPRPIFSVVTTYLIVAALSIGTVIAFGLAALAFPRTITTTTYDYTEASYDGSADGLVDDPVCAPPSVYTSESPSYDRVWGVLAANPYVVLVDAVPSRFDLQGNAVDAFTNIKTGVRSVQIPQDSEVVYNNCTANPEDDYRTAEATVAQTVPSWFVGLAIHVVLGALCLLAGARALRTPSRRLARGSRIA